ncbi:MAG: hypothetical protein K1X66_03555 [Verrucomicrobiae bacterium]|nr:hypothetical protein [Verrucomicrobiae bacterium]
MRKINFFLSKYILCLTLFLFATVKIFSAISPEAEKAINIINGFSSNHPNVYIKTKTVGQGGGAESDIYKFKETGKEEVWRLQIKSAWPPSLYVLFPHENKIYAYFPLTKQVTLAQDVSSQSQFFEPSKKEVFDLKVFGDLITDSSVAKINDQERLNLVFDTEKMIKKGLLPQNVSDLIVSIDYKPSGEIIKIEQTVNGIKIVSSMEYITFDINKIKELAPVVPEVADTEIKKSFSEAFAEEIEFFKNKENSSTEGNTSEKENGPINKTTTNTVNSALKGLDSDSNNTNKTH